MSVLDPNADTFNSSATDDNTSTPPIPGFSTLEGKPQNPVMQALSKAGKTKIKPFGGLASAIARAKRPRQTGRRWG